MVVLEGTIIMPLVVAQQGTLCIKGGKERFFVERPVSVLLLRKDLNHRTTAVGVVQR